MISCSFFRFGKELKESWTFAACRGWKMPHLRSQEVFYEKGAGRSASLFMQGSLSPSALHCFTSHLCLLWLSLFILFARSDFPRQPDDLNDPRAFFFTVSSSWAVSVFQSGTAAGLLLKNSAGLTFIGSCGTRLHLPAEAKLKFSANCWHLNPVQKYLHNVVPNQKNEWQASDDSQKVAQ